MNLHRIVLYFLLMASPMLFADPAWQVLPRNSSVRGFFQTDTSLYSISSNSDVRVTKNGVDWPLVTQLGTEGWVREFVTTSAGISVWYKDIEGESSDPVYKLFHTTDGEHWEKAQEFTPDPEGNMSLSDPIKTSSGWLMHTSLSPPAIVWYSDDGIFWNEKFRDNEQSITESLSGWRTDGTYAIKFRNHESINWIRTSDGRIWEEITHQPVKIIELDTFSIGINNSPNVTGTLFYSTDNQSWESVFDPDIGSTAQRLMYADGVFVLTQAYQNVYYSQNGRDWEASILPDEIHGLSRPLRITNGYFEGSFYYRLEPTAPPGSPVPGEPFTLKSPDGREWTITKLPDSFSNEALLPEENPHYLKVASPLPLSERNPLPPGEEIEHAGYRLKMEEIPEGDRMGLYLAEGQGAFEIVNSTWSRNDKEYPYAEPVDIGFAGNALLAVSETGYTAVFDPAANYLPQPMDLTVSRGNYDDRIELSWNPVPGADLYRIYRGTEPGLSDRDQIAEVNTTEFTDRNGIELYQRYYYQVQSEGSNGEISLPGLPVSGYLWSINNVNKGSWSIVPGPHADSDRSLYFDAESSTALHQVMQSHYPWIWSWEHHWWYSVEKPGNLWFYDLQLGWLWTRKSYYPNLYSWKDSEWLYFYAAGENMRWFYNYDQNEYRPLER